MAVEESLSIDELEYHEKQAQAGRLPTAATVAAICRQLINMLSLWKLKRLWRYAGVVDEQSSPNVLKDRDMDRLKNYLLEYWDVVAIGSSYIVNEAIRLLERCRGERDASPEEMEQVGFGRTLIPESTIQAQSPAFTMSGDPPEPPPADEPEPEAGASPDEGKPGRRRGPDPGHQPGEGRGPTNEGEAKPGKGQPVGPGERGKGK